jgi:hypothetical protein
MRPHRPQRSNQRPALTTTKPAQLAVDPYAGWKTYTSQTEKLKFKHPSDWTSVDYTDSTATGKADSVQLFSPSKQVTVYWISQEGGKGGACNANVFPAVLKRKTIHLVRAHISKYWINKACRSPVCIMLPVSRRWMERTTRRGWLYKMNPGC